jgi:hypothetical protein
MIVESRFCMNIAHATINEMISCRVRGVMRAVPCPSGGASPGVSFLFIAAK